MRSQFSLLILLIATLIPGEAFAQTEKFQLLDDATDQQVISLANFVSAKGVSAPELQQKLANKLQSENLAVRVACVDAIPYLGKPSEKIIDQMYESIKLGGRLPDTRAYAAVAAASIAKIGPAVLPAAIKRLETDHRLEFAGVTDVIHQLGPAAEGAVEPLLKRLDAGDKDTWAICFALEGIGEKAAPAVEKLQKLLESDNFNIVCIACRALSRIGKAAQPAKKQLMKVAREGNVSERGRAIQALGGIQALEDEEVRQIFEDNIAGFNYSIRERVVLGIRLAGESAKACQPMLKSALDDPNFKPRPAAAAAYIRAGGPVPDSLSIISKFINHPTYEMQAIEVLGELEEIAKPLLPALLAKLESNDDALRADIIRTIGRIGIDTTSEEKLKEIEKTGQYQAARAAREVLTRQTQSGAQ